MMTGGCSFFIPAVPPTRRRTLHKSFFAYLNSFSTGPATDWRTLTFSTSGSWKGPRIFCPILSHPFPSTAATVTSLNRSLPNVTIHLQ